MNLEGRSVYLVTYDVSDPKRLTKTRKALLGFGDHLQLSVFRCELTARETVELRRVLSEIIHAGEDQVLVVDLGPADGRGAESIRTLGRALREIKHQATVI